MVEKQRTLKKEVSLSGKGLHTGVEVTMTFKPAPGNHGYVFVRTDLEGAPKIKAIADNVTETVRGTTLEQNGASVATIEHCMAALYGMGIDNVLIEVNGPEAPILDGSSIRYVEAFKEAGIVEQDAKREYFEVKEKISYSDEERGVDIMIYPDDHLSINVLIDYNSKVLGNQYAILNQLDEFEEEIAMSRTFVFFHELEGLAKLNKIKGGDLDNAIVILDRKVAQEEIDRIADLFHKPHIKANSEGVLSNVDLHFPNEPARHKLLDLLGDIALVGMPLKGKIVATRPGHKANNEFARKIRQAIKKAAAQKDIPEYDPNVPPLMDVLEVRKRLPHRYPFLLVDKILSMDEDSVVGLKNLTYDELFFQGHFPDEPVMPGVLQIEFMAQVGGMLVLSQVDDPENYGTYFLKIDKVKFKSKVVPGDTLIAKVVLAGPIRRGIVTVFAQAFVGNRLVVEGELMAQVFRKKTEDDS
jgi:UDP-3-O-[3-hydroxymyristoyl] N-acetylglucosamine deacetylase/3-hydroxyacyl-[acyl-carrier-protein] dehydratase